MDNELEKSDAENALPENKKSKKKDKAERDGRKKREKKKKGCCSCRCFLTTAIVSVILVVGAIFGGAYFAYTYWAEPILNMKFGEAFRVVTGLYKADEDKIITNKYDPESDLDAFLTGFSDSLYLSEPIKREDLSKLFGSQNEDHTDNPDQGTVADEIQPGTPPTEESGTGNVNFDEVLKDMEFDFSSLKDYDGTSIPAFCITDRMLAAVFNDILVNGGVLDSLTSNLGDGAKDAISVRQVIIDKVNSAADETTISFTLSADIRKLLSSALSSMPEFLQKMIQGVLPKTLYFTGTITPLSESAPKLQINSIDQTLMDKTIKAIDRIINNNGDSENSLSAMLDNVGKQIFDIFAEIRNVAGSNAITFSKAEGVGSVDIELFSMAINAMGIQNVSVNDFFIMIKHLHSFDFSGITYEEYVSTLNTSSPADFDKNIKQLLAGYGIKEDSTIYTTDNFAEMLKKIPEKITPDSIIEYGKDLINKSQEELAEMSRINEKTLTEILKHTLNKNADGDNATPFRIELLELKLDGENIVMTAYANTEKMLETMLKDNPLAKLIASIFPEQLYIKMITPYERKTTGNSTDILFNYDNNKPNISIAESDRMLNTLAMITQSLGGDAIDKDTLCKQIDDIIYPALEDMHSADGKMILSFQKGYIQLPTCRDLLGDKFPTIKPDIPTLTDSSANISLRDSLTAIFDCAVPSANADTDKRRLSAA